MVVGEAIVAGLTVRQEMAYARCLDYDYDENMIVVRL